MVIARYLVDTDWAVYYLRGKEPYVSTLRRFQAEGVAISIVSVAELYEGVFRSADRQAKEEGLERFLAGLGVADVSRGVARTFGRLRAELRKQGMTVADFDLLIASTAVYYGLTLLTDNRRHYEKVPELKLVE